MERTTTDEARRKAAASAVRAIIAGEADVAAVASAFGLPLDLRRESVVAALLDIASPPAEVVPLRRVSPPSALTQGADAGGTPATAGGAIDPEAAAKRAAKAAEQRKKDNVVVLRSYRIKS